jgi:DNA polymerase I-like protein with 3'-5' exonuclease and polymerase domains
MQGSLFMSDPAPGDWSPDQLPERLGDGPLGFDTETTGLKWWEGARPIGLSITTPNGPVYLPWGHSSGNLPEERVLEWARRELRGVHLVGHNIRFDVHQMREWGVDLVAQGCTFTDTGHLAALLDDHRQKFSLEAIAQDYLGTGKVEDTLDKSRMADYGAHEVTAYGRGDATLPLDLYNAMMPTIEEQGLERVLDLERRVIPVVLEMERNGAPIDLEKLERWDREAEAEIHTLFFKLTATAGFRVEPTKASSMEKLYEKLGVKVARTANGQVALDDATLKPLAEQHPALALARRIRQLSSLRSKFLAAYREAVGSDGIMRYGLHQLRGGQGGTVSGRFSSSAPAGRGSGINVQQVMSAENQEKNLGPGWTIRELFVPGEGLFFGSDARQIEYRLFAHYANSPAILKAYEEDPTADFHQTVTDMIRPVMESITRKHAKNVNFARLYGAGVKKVAAMLGVSEAEARVFLKAYDRAFPEVSRLAAQATRYAESRGWVKTLLGRRSRFPGGERSHKALNTIIQGTAADVMKLKLVELYEAREDLGLTLRFTVHDEVCGDVPDAEVAERAHQLLSRQSLDLRVPLLWESAHGATWAECK